MLVQQRCLHAAGRARRRLLGGSFSYDQLHAQSNGRAWLLSTDAGLTVTDLTQDADPSHAEVIHPDQHAIVTLPGKPLQFITGSDGGVVRSDGRFGDVSGKCDDRDLDASDTALCKRLLARVANKLVNMNNGLSTLQFQSLSVSAQRPQNLLQGGTQDNGTFQYNGSRNVWPQVIYGDGGQSGFNAANDTLRFNTFTGQANDANFSGGDPTKWVIISAPILSSPESAFFYPPIIADPHAAVAGSIFQGSYSVWRTQDWGGNPALLEANCPEFTTSATKAGCGDFVRIGPAGATDLTDQTTTVYGATRRGGAVAWIERTAQNTGTMWVATSAGRVFITDNANDPAASVVWKRVDSGTNAEPGRVHQCDRGRPGKPPSCVDFVQRIQHQHAGHPRSRVPGDLERRGDCDLGRCQQQPARFSHHRGGEGPYPGRPVCRVRLRRDDAAGRHHHLGRGWQRVAHGRSRRTHGFVPERRVLYAATHGRSAWSLTLP